MHSGSRLNVNSSLNNRLKGSKGQSSVDAAAKHRSRATPGSNSRNSAATHHQYSDERRVYNAEGVDVTPRPLLKPRDEALLPRPESGSGGVASMSQTGELRLTGRRSSKTKAVMPPVIGNEENDDRNKTAAMEASARRGLGDSGPPGLSINTNVDKPILRKAGTTSNLMHGGMRSAAPTGLLSPSAALRAAAAGGQQGGAMVEDVVMEVLHLKETATQVIFDLRGLTVAMDAKEKPMVEVKNAHYASLSELHQYQDRFAENHSQTSNPLVKHKQAQAAPASTREVGCTATGFDIHDSEVLEVADEDELGRSVNPLLGGKGASAFQNPEMSAKLDDMVRLSLVSRGCLINVDEGQRRTGPQAAQAHPRHSKFSQAELEEDARSIINKEDAEKVMKSDKLARSLALVEMAVQQNLHFREHAKYRDLPTIQDVDEMFGTKPAVEAGPKQGGARFTPFGKSPAGGASPGMPKTSFAATETDPLPSGRDTLTTSTASLFDDSSTAAPEEGPGGSSSNNNTPALGGKRALEKLWDFNCASLTSGRQVICMAWSTARATSKGSLTQVAEDLLAVGYTSDMEELSVVAKGLVLFWSIRNSHYPERIIRTHGGVTAVAPSKAHPSMLAVGMSDGVLAIYDTFRDEDFDTPLLESSALPGSSYEPIWQIRWVERPDKTERLISISNDGHVMEWDMKKGLACQLIMVLKRAGETTGLLSSYAFGLCFDFLPNDSSLYLAGTEDGMVLKCSCSYNEQSLESSEAHMGPIYAIRFSPFAHDIYLTAGGDWSVRIWQESHNTKALHTIQSSALSEIVSDAAWSPIYETVLAAVTGDGKVLIWDLAKSLMDPVVTYVHYKNAELINHLCEAQLAGQKNDPVARRNTLIKAAMAAQKLQQKGGGGGADAENDMGRANNAQNDRGLQDAQSKGLFGGPGGRGGTTGGQHPPIMAKQLVKCTCLAFSETAAILATGTSTGVVEVFRLVGFDEQLVPDQADGEHQEDAPPCRKQGEVLKSLFRTSPGQRGRRTLGSFGSRTLDILGLFFLGVAILYANIFLFSDILKEVVVAFVLAQSLKKGRQVISDTLTYLDTNGDPKEPVVEKLERLSKEFVTHLSQSNPIDCIKNYSLAILPVLGTCLLLVRLAGPIPSLGLMIVLVVAAHAGLAHLDRKLFGYRKHLSDRSMASLITMLVCLVALSSLGTFLVGGSVLELFEAGRKTSAFMSNSVLSSENKEKVMQLVDQGTQQVMAQVTPYLENATVALNENRVKFGDEWWWPTVDNVATGLLEGTKAAAAGNDTDAEALYQVVVGSFQGFNVTEFIASVNTTAIMVLLDVGTLAGKAAGAGVSILDLLLKVLGSAASFMGAVVSGLLSVLGLVSFLGSLFWFLDHPHLLTTLLDDVVPISAKTQADITDTIQESIERVLLLPLKLASSHGIITLLTFSILCVDFPFLATALSILLTMVPLLPPKLLVLPWTIGLVASYRSFVPIIPAIDFIHVPAPLKGLLLLGLHVTIMDKVDQRLFALPVDHKGRRPQAWLTSLAFILGYQKFGSAGLVAGPGILCLGELFYSLLKNLKVNVMRDDAEDEAEQETSRPPLPEGRDDKVRDG